MPTHSPIPDIFIHTAELAVLPLAAAARSVSIQRWLYSVTPQLLTPPASQSITPALVLAVLTTICRCSCSARCSGNSDVPAANPISADYKSGKLDATDRHLR